MFFFSPLIFLILCSLALRPYLENWRVALLLAAIITATALTALTEILSLFQALSFYPLILSWLLFIIAIGIVAILSKVKWSFYFSFNLNTWFLSEKILLSFIVFICVISAVTALLGIPNNWDSMTYHLSRVMHWIQNRTIAFYPTNITRQLYVTPWAEYAIANVRILGGGETSGNFIQWFSMIGSLIGVSLIAGQLGANRMGQLMAAMFAATLPMGILQSVSTQNDYVCALWMVAFVYFIIENQRTFSSCYALAAGLSLGLAILTKGNSYIFVIPFLLWYLSANFKKQIQKSLLGLLLITCCALSLNFGQYIRTAQIFGSPFWTNVSLTNESYDLKVLWVNVLRNLSIHLSTPSMYANDSLKEGVTRAAQFFGADINDPRASFEKDFYFHTMGFDEDYVGNFLHALLFGIVFILSFFNRGPKGRIVFYVCTLLCAFLLFCLIVRYQPWNSRFHLPLFILFCPLAGVILGNSLKKWCLILGILFFLAALPWLFLNKHHPWGGFFNIWKDPPTAQYFYKNPELFPVYSTVSQYIISSGCKQLGLLIGEDSFEYPWWGILNGSGTRIEHVGVTNASSALEYPLGDFEPCVVIASGVEPPPLVMVGNLIYAPIGTMPEGDSKISIYLRKP